MEFELVYYDVSVQHFSHEDYPFLRMNQYDTIYTVE